MTELLTSRQVEKLLSVDRTTVYRMLKDGRLTGVKVGHRWRFRAEEINGLISKPASQNGKSLSPTEVLPLPCIESIQMIFAQITDVGAVTVGENGQPLTEFSNSCSFCSMIMDSPEGGRACAAFRRQLSSSLDADPQFVKCHAGLYCMSSPIKVDGNRKVAIISGQYYLTPPDAEEQTARLYHLAALYNLNGDQLNAAVQKVPVLDERKKSNMGLWLQEVAGTFTKLCKEKADMLKRMSVISDMSNLGKSVSGS